jgi:hypothetical protein
MVGAGESWGTVRGWNALKSFLNAEDTESVEWKKE